MGRVERFIDVFEFLMKLSMERPLTLFIDEFQEFFRVNKSVYSDMPVWQADTFYDSAPFYTCRPEGNSDRV